MAIDYGILKVDGWLPRPPRRLTCQLIETYEPGEDGIIVFEMDWNALRDANTGSVDYDAYLTHLMNEYVGGEADYGRQVSDEDRSRAENFFSEMVDWMKRNHATAARLCLSF